MPDPTPRRIYLVAGEASGDAHGARLIEALGQQEPSLTFEGLGGMKMQAAGMRLDYDLAGEGIMGFVEVLKHAPRLTRLIKTTAAKLRANPPAALVLIDYPGFNIRLAKLLEGSGIPVIYYISPQVWAWKKGRIHTLAKVCRKMLVIFPFEEKLYQEVGLDVAFVGHPLVEHVAGMKEEVGELWSSRDSMPQEVVPESNVQDVRMHQSPPTETVPHSPAPGNTSHVIGLLPGSRAQEIARVFPPMLKLARALSKERPGLRFVAPCVNDARAEQIRKLAKDFPLDILTGGMHDVLSTARFCLVASGTATLETAVFGVPMIILYRVSPITYALARLLVDIKHIGMVNILAGREVVPEHVQSIRVPHILPQALSLIDDTPARQQMLHDLDAVRQMLGGGGASQRAAQEILAVLNNGTP
jgi:lipid-A-disaccharide synthase